MTSIVARFKDDLEAHGECVIMANASTGWFAVFPTTWQERTETARRDGREGPNLVVYRTASGNPRDHYVVPYAAARELLVANTLTTSTVNGSQRWNLTLKNGKLHVSHRAGKVDVSQHYGVRLLIEEVGASETAEPPRTGGHTIAEVAMELNVRCTDRAIGRLQDLRRHLSGRERTLTRKLFDRRTIFDHYAFHVGGRTELQFNVGFESRNGQQHLRYGVAFSLEPSRSLPNINVLAPKIAKFNEFLRIHPEEFNDLQMWHFVADQRSMNYSPAPISPEMVTSGVFICLGELQPLTAVNFDRILDIFDRLLPLYRYVEGTDAYPTLLTDVNGFRFKPGCTLKRSRTTASTMQRELDVSLRHNEIQHALYQYLSAKHGPHSVGTEQGNGAGIRVDVVVSLSPAYWFYEIKTAASARGAIREALSQLLEYSFWPGMQAAERLIVVAEAPLDSESAAFLRSLREQFALPIYYEQFDMQLGVLLENTMEAERG